MCRKLKAQKNTHVFQLLPSETARPALTKREDRAEIIWTMHSGFSLLEKSFADTSEQTSDIDQDDSRYLPKPERWLRVWGWTRTYILTSYLRRINYSCAFILQIRIYPPWYNRLVPVGAFLNARVTFFCRGKNNKKKIHSLVLKFVAGCLAPVEEVTHQSFSYPVLSQPPSSKRIPAPGSPSPSPGLPDPLWINLPISPSASLL